MTARAVACALACAAVLLGRAVPVAADDAATFEAALAVLERDPAAGVAALDALATTSPDGILAPEAALAAARAVEERLLEPAAARDRYARLAATWPDARAAVAATRRAEALAARLGTAPEGALLAAAFARLRAGAGAVMTPADDAESQRLAAAAWPGAPEVGLWRVEALRRADRLAAAAAEVRALRGRVVGTPWEVEVTRAAAQVALAQRAWAEAAALAATLPAGTAEDDALRAELAGAIADGRRNDRWYLGAWLVVLAGLVALAASLAHAGRGGAWRAARRPPIEAWYLAPIALLLIIAAATGFVGIARAVAWIAGGGVVVAWLSGAGLDVARATGRLGRGRIVTHALIAPVVVLALAVIGVVDADLVEVVLATAEHGPDR